jgi:lipopolysaccharide transport system ATP-binding protein
MASGAESRQEAIVLRGVTKHFKRNTIRHEFTTFKSELVKLLTGRRKRQQAQLIEALRGVDLTIPRGKTVGILGRNGSGKSTLLKLITGIYGPTTGTIQVHGRISALLDLGAGFHPDFSGRENILINGIILGMSRAEVKARMEEIITFSELGDFIDEPVRTYSSGMYMRLAFSVATHVDPEILIVDEILAVGDEHFGKKSMAKMEEFKRAGKTIVLVTHDLSTVERWCDLAAWIDGGRIRRVGTPAELVREYRAAVSKAEEQGAALTPAALATDGGALPEVAQVPVATPAASPLVLKDVRVVRSGGAPAETVSTEEALELRIDVEASGPTEGLALGVALVREDGLRLYTTSTRVDGVAVPARGRLTLHLERLGLLAGRYALEVSVLDPEGTALATRRAEPGVSVAGVAGEEGLFRLPHRWDAEPEAAESAGGTRVRVS